MTRLLTHEDVQSVINTSLAIEALTEVFQLEGQGQCGEPHRFDIGNGHGWLRLMAVVTPGIDAFGFKAMNLAEGVGVRYAIWLYDLRSGNLRGILDARTITAMRTAATTAVATRELAREDVGRTAIIGTGAEARTHLHAVQHVRPVEQIMIYSRSPENRQRFIEELQPDVEAELIDCSRLEEAVADTDVIVLATKSPQPVLHAEHLQAGMHVNSIGAARLDQYELAPDAFARFSAIVCDSARHVFSEAGDAVDAKNAGVIDEQTAVNLGDVVVGRAAGRTSPEGITLFKSVGTATQDIALAKRLLDLAEERGIGQKLDGFPDMKAFG